jgi:hypothetical protein
MMHIQRSATANAALANGHWTAWIELRQIGQQYCHAYFCHDGVLVKAKAAQRMTVACEAGAGIAAKAIFAKARHWCNPGECRILHCTKTIKRSLLKGQWPFGWLLCIGAAGIRG